MYICMYLYLFMCTYSILIYHFALYYILLYYCIYIYVHRLGCSVKGSGEGLGLRVPVWDLESNGIGSRV